MGILNYFYLIDYSIHVNANMLHDFLKEMNLLDILAQPYRFTETLNQHPWSAVMFASAGCTASVMASGSLLPLYF